MKNFIVKSFNRLLVFLAGALGFTGCEQPVYPTYGCPPESYCDLDISGFVVDENGEPIQDIEVSYAQVNDENDQDTVVVKKSKSKADGSFALRIWIDSEPIGVIANLVTAKDVDGETNGNYETEIKVLDQSSIVGYSNQKLSFVLREKPETPDPEDNGEDNEE